MFRREEVGTFGKRYLEVVEERVYGAVLLEQGMSVNASSNWTYGKSLECEGCGSNMIIDIIDHEAFCPECGAKIVIARENEHYSMQAEPVCDNCGLVYDTKNLIA